MNEKKIVAVVCTNPEKVSASGVFVYTAKDDTEKTEISFLLSKVVVGMVHELSEEVNLIVIH